MTLLVLLAAAAGAGLVPADFRFLSADLLDGCVVTTHARRLPVVSARHGRGTGSNGAAKSRRRFGGSSAEDQRLLRPRGLPRHRRRVFSENRPQPPQQLDRLLVNAGLHVLEQLEAFFLVLDERIALTVASQADAFLQVVQAVEVIL